MRKYTIPIVVAVTLAVIYYLSFEHVQRHEADLSPSQQVVVKQLVTAGDDGREKIAKNLEAERERVHKMIADTQKTIQDNQKIIIDKLDLLMKECKKK